MEILQNFGVQPILLVAQIVNFLVIFWLLKKFLYKPVLTLLHNRKKTIEEGLLSAEENKKLLEETEKREKEVLRKAHNEAKALIDDAKKESAALIAKSKDEAKIEVAAMIKHAQEQIALDARETEKRLVQHVNALAVDLVKVSIKDLVPDKDQKEIVENAAKQFKASA